jgi:hypothetical protein
VSSNGVRSRLNEGRTRRRKLNARERARVFDYVRDRRGEGYTTNQIAAALGLGDSSISDYMRQMGINGARVGTTASRELPELEPFDWADKTTEPARPYRELPPTVDVPLAYTRSTTLALLNGTLSQLRSDSATVRLAHDVEDAHHAADEEWLRHAGQVLQETTQYLHGLTQLLISPAQRGRVIRDPSFRDEFGPHHPHLRSLG